jgi:hypothetical protein
MDNFVFSDVLHNNILKNRRHLCPNGCGRHYKRRCLMNYNLKFECGICLQFKCPYCSKLFYRKFSLKTHCACIHNVLLNSTLIIK